MFTIKESDGRVYEFEFEGKVYGLPVMDELAMEELSEITELIDAGQGGNALARAFYRVFEKYCPGVPGRLKRAQFADLVNDYIDEARRERGADLGESAGSSD